MPRIASHASGVRVSRHQCAVMLSILFFSLPVLAVNRPGESTIRVYPVSFFESAQPRTALDLVDRLPGFSIDGGDNDVRGYSGSAGNVLIDGRRPVSKQDNVATVLDRIPVGAVARVELIRGTSTDIDMQGWSVIANVVRREEASTNARVLGAVRVYEDGPVRPEVRVEAIQSAPGYVAEGSLHVFDVRNDSGNGYRRRTATDGELLYDADRELDSDRQGFAATTGYERLTPHGDLRINAILSGNRSGTTEVLTEFVSGNSNTVFDNDSSDLSAEIGVQASRAFADSSRLAFLAIQQLRRFDTEETETGAPQSQLFTEDGRSGETILRASVRTTLPQGHTVEWGGEAAFNFLDSDAVANVDGEPVDLPVSSADVRETRAELFGRFGWIPVAGMTADVGTAAEFSRIKQRGAAASSKSLFYLKPRAALTWTPALSDQVRLNLQRTVGQLDFGDFVSSAELSTGTVNVGNTDLEPSTAWELEASWERQFSEDSTFVVSLLHAEISDVIDIAPLAVQDADAGEVIIHEGLANIGDGRQSEIGFDLSLSLERLGVSGGLLNANIAYIRTSVTDPVTREPRKISGIEYPWDGTVQFTQDLPERNFRWGVTVPFGDSQPEYRPEEVRLEKKSLRLDLFAEYFPDPEWALGVSFQNLSRRERSLHRDFYDAPRNVGQIDATAYEFLELEAHVRFYAQRSFL